VGLLDSQDEQERTDSLCGFEAAMKWVGGVFALAVVLAIPYFCYAMGHFSDYEETLSYQITTNSYFLFLILSTFGFFLRIAVASVHSFQKLESIGQIFAHGFHFGQSVLIADAVGGGDAFMQAGEGFGGATLFDESLGGHLVGRDVVGIVS
jgi:hypothetical protein